ncbi:MAG: hypothetical protein LAN36_09045 [Acidobacteriia bacterium]|nr:hypothetical protein [Terriglobia bacterium]
MNLRRLAQAAAILLGCVASMGASGGLPDWSGQWEIVGATPDATGGFNQSLDEVLKTMQWSPPNNPELQARVDKIVAAERQRLEAVNRGEDPGGAVRACTFGYPLLMLDSPLMFEVLPTPKETTLIFSSREIRHVYTDGRPHTAKEDLWATPWGDSIGHWEGQTLVIDTIAVKSPFASSESEGVAVLAFGDVEGAQTITILSPQARFIERIRMIDKDHLEDQMTVIDPTSFTAPWHVRRTYQRVTHIHRMVYEDCEGEDRNPIVNGKFTLAPPSSGAPPATAPNSAPSAQSPPPQ